MCDMSSHVDTINKNKSTTLPPTPPNLMASLVALVYSVINFVNLFIQDSFVWITNHNLQMFLNYLELFTGFAKQFMMVL